MAAAVGSAALALFGPTDDHVWAPRGPRDAVLRDVHAAHPLPVPLLRTWWRERPPEPNLDVEMVLKRALSVLAKR